jgi:hypothetical protein
LRTYTGYDEERREMRELLTTVSTVKCPMLMTTAASSREVATPWESGYQISLSPSFAGGTRCRLDFRALPCCTHDDADLRCKHILRPGSNTLIHCLVTTLAVILPTHAAPHDCQVSPVQGSVPEVTEPWRPSSQVAVLRIGRDDFLCSPRPLRAWNAPYRWVPTSLTPSNQKCSRKWHVWARYNTRYKWVMGRAN